METFSLSSFILSRHLPLWVRHVPRGTHYTRRFHNHNFSEIVIVFQGRAKHLVGGDSCDIGVGDVLVIPAKCCHAYDNTAEFELTNIIFDLEQLPIPLLDASLLPFFHTLFKDSRTSVIKPVMRLSADELGAIGSLIVRLDTELKGQQAGNLFHGLTLFMEILISLAKMENQREQVHSSPPHFAVGAAIKFMNTRFAQAITVGELAKLTHMSERTFFRRFQNAAGCAPLEFLRRLRVRKASDLLLSTDKSLNEIAIECGFGDSNYFCRVFRGLMGSSPACFRKNHGRPA